MPPDGTRSVLHDEILEQPGAVARLLERETRNAAVLAAGWRRARVPFVLIAARGTSDNAVRYAQYAFGLASRLPVALAAPPRSASRARGGARRPLVARGSHRGARSGCRREASCDANAARI